MSEHEERLREHLGKNMVYETVLLHDLRAMFCDIDTLRASQNALLALLREAREDWIKVGYGASHEDVAACRDVCDRIDNMIGGSK